MFITLIYSVSIDCPNVISLATAANLHIKEPTIMNKINLDCCDSSWTRVTCNSNQRVTAIEWNYLNLNGKLNVSAIPSTTKIFSVANNLLKGSVSSIPSGLTKFDIGANSFTGSIPELPVNMLTLDVVENNLNGSISTLNNKLQYLFIYSNMLDGTLPMLPSTLIGIYCYNNLFYGQVPLFPQSLKYLYLGSSTFGSGLYGPLVIDSVSMLFIPNNYITDITIAHPELIEYCNLSNNPLLGKLSNYPYIPCTKNNLYVATSSNTPTTNVFSSKITILSITIPQTRIATIATSSVSLNVGKSTTAMRPTSAYSPLTFKTISTIPSSTSASSYRLYTVTIRLISSINSIYSPFSTLSPTTTNNLPTTIANYTFVESLTVIRSDATTTTQILSTQSHLSLTTFVKQPTTLNIRATTSKSTTPSSKTTPASTASIISSTQLQTIEIIATSDFTINWTFKSIAILFIDTTVLLHILRTLYTMKKHKPKRKQPITMSFLP